MTGRPETSSNVQKAFKDVDTLKREEWNRRRILRYEQVRQQSKDIANLIRQKVHSEREKQLGLVQERVDARTHQWQVRKIKSLQSEYESTVQNVGKGHADASSLPDEEAIRKAESEKMLAEAQRRGQEALNRLKEEETARRKADEERRLQLLSVRALEEARSAAVVALPRPESTVGIKSLPPKTSVSVSVPPAKVNIKSAGKSSSKNLVPEWPKRSWPQQALPLGIIPREYESVQGDSARTGTTKKTEDDFHRELCTSVPVSSHGDSANIVDLEHPRELVKPSRPSSSMANVSVPDVKLYDYSSCYQSQYDKIPSIVEKVHEAGEVNAKEAADREISSEISHQKTLANLGEREQQRSREAIQRVQAQRDYKELMGSLTLLAKQKAALCSYRNVPDKQFTKTNSNEDQLNLAVENLLQDVETNISSCHSTDTPDGSLILSHLEDTPGSVPRLNVGRWHSSGKSDEQAASPIAVSSSTDSFITVPAPHDSIASARQENIDRDFALRSLVQRINDERQSLLSSQQPLNVSSQANQDTEIRHLEERVLQQRQQLKEQRSEVKRLDESIVISDCVKQSQDVSKMGSSHESIIIEPSYTEESQDNSPSPPSTSEDKSLGNKAKKSKSKKSKLGGKFSAFSPSKDSVKYSMDVSLSSVIMDQTEDSSSGSKSMSLHGVQVLVKVRGTEEDSTESRSASVEQDQLERVEDIASDGDVSSPPRLLEKPHREKKQGEKVKGKCEVSAGKLTKSSGERPIKVSHKDKNAPQERKKTSKSVEVDVQSSKAGKQLEKPKVEGKRTLKNEPKVDCKNQKTKPKKRRAEEDKQEPPASSSTSYLSPPDRVLSSLTEDIRNLIALAQSNMEPQQRNFQSKEQVPENLPLIQYINRLLTMSRDSIDRLNISCSEVSTPASNIFYTPQIENDSELNITDIGFAGSAHEGTIQSSISSSQDHSERNPDIQENVSDGSQIGILQPDADHWLFHPASNDQATLTDMTKQCHEKISALTKMIEEVRRQAVVDSPSQNDSDFSSHTHDQSRSPIPLDSTAYMSPPPQVLEWADFALPPQSAQDLDNRMSLDPYGAAVMQLLADVRSHMTHQGTNLSEPSGSSFLKTAPQDQQAKKIMSPKESGPSHPKPPVAFWRNIERCNVTSPTEPHELSTILELGTTLPESVECSRENALVSPNFGPSSPSTPGTPPDVIAELMRRKLLTSPFAWAKRMDKPHQSSDSSTSFKNSLDSDVSSRKSGAGQSDISASKETNTVSIPSQNSSSNGSRDWKTNMLMSPADMYSSADEVEGDFRRMGIGWVGAMLRKTKEAGALSSTSSSEGGALAKIGSNDFKDLSAMTDEEPILSSSLIVSLMQGRGHSTPVKHPSDVSSSSGSHLV